MSKSTSETGHAVNISNGKLLIDACTGFGADYNPSNEDITIVNLTKQWTTAQNANNDVSSAKQSMKEPINQRALLYQPLNPLVTKVMAALTSSKANDLVKKDAKGIADCIRGAKKKEPKAAATKEATEELATTSQSHMSYVQRASALLDLANLLSTVKEYNPNEEPLKVASLVLLQKQMQAANDGIGAVIQTGEKAELVRDRALYKEGSGLLDLAQVCRDYVKSVFGSKAAEYKQVTAIKFRDLAKKEKDEL